MSNKSTNGFRLINYYFRDFHFQFRQKWTFLEDIDYINIIDMFLNAYLLVILGVIITTTMEHQLVFPTNILKQYVFKNATKHWFS